MGFLHLFLFIYFIFIFSFLRLDLTFCSSVLHAGPRQEDSPLSPMGYQVHPSYPTLQTQVNFIHIEMRGVGFRESGGAECETETVDEEINCACMDEL